MKITNKNLNQEESQIKEPLEKSYLEMDDESNLYIIYTNLK